MPLGFMVASLRIATRSPASSSCSEEARTLTRFTPSSRTISTTSAREPERFGRATSRRLPGSLAPTRCTNALRTSEEVTMPTRRSSPSTTGWQPIFLSYIAIAASSIGSSGRAVATSQAISSATRIRRSASARVGSPRAGVAARRSRSEIMPASRPPSRTGRCRILFSRHSARASAAVVSDPTVTTSRVIESRTSSISTSPGHSSAPRRPPRIIWSTPPSRRCTE